MPKKKHKTIDVSKFRQRAEEALEVSSGDNGYSYRLSPDEMKTLIHDLQVHQIELEMQNDELRRTQRELEVSRERYFDLYNLAPVGYVTVSEKGLILEANLISSTFLCEPRNELAKRPFSNFILQQDQDIYYLHRKQLFETEKPQAFELRMVRLEEPPFWARLEMTIAEQEGGTRVCRLILTDITERKQIEEERDRVLNLSIDLICIAGLDGYFRYLNPAWEKTLGYTTEELLDRPFLDFIHPDDHVKNNDEVKNLATNQKTINFENRYIAKDDSIHNISWTATPLLSKGLIYCIGRDITERKVAEAEKGKLEAKLKQVQKMEAIGTLAGGIAHDFNNILSSILGFAQLVKQDLFEHDSELKSNIDQVIIAGHRATDLVQHILTFSRHSEIDKKPLLVSLLIKEIIKFLRASLPASIEIKTNILCKDATILGDATQIHQIVMNLCTNATQAMKKEGGILTICLEKKTLTFVDISEQESIEPGDFIKLSISDTGHGIPNETINRIFDPFFTTKKRGEGTGMGLSVAHGIIEEMGGTITVESEPDKGSAFHIMIPMHKKEPVHDIIEHGKMIRKGDGRILFVDDEMSILKFTNKMLSRAGYTVTTVNNSLDALVLFESDPKSFDLIITDLDMPKMDGIEFSKQILEKRPGIPIILSTGVSRKITQEFLDEIGIYKLIMKPIISSELIKIINSAINKIQ